MFHRTVALASVVLMWCALPGCQTTPAAAQTRHSTCPRWQATGHATSQVDLEALDESSGLAWHKVRPKVLWTHNDSGGQPRLFGVSLSGEHRVTVKLPEQVEHTDWEDLAVGGCPGEPAAACIAIGDIGDNGADRESVTVYWVTVPPAPERGDAGGVQQVEAELRATWSIRYEDGAGDAEGMFVGPGGEHLWIVRKSPTGKSGVYRVERSQGSATRRAERVGELSLAHALPPGRMVTGATLGPKGRTVFLRTYLSVVTLVPAGQSFGSWPSGRKRVWSTPTIWQSEAIAVVGADRLAMTGERVPAPLLVTSIRDACGETAGSGE